MLHKMFNSEGRATCSVQRATCSLTGIDQWGLRHCRKLPSRVRSGVPETELSDFEHFMPKNWAHLEIL